MVRRRAPPALGSAIQVTALTISASESPVIFAASAIETLLAATALSKSLVEAPMKVLSIQPFYAA
jgi:hypothetical protein